MRYFLFTILIFLISTKLYAESGGGRFVKIEDLNVAGIKVGDNALSHYSKSKLLDTKYDWFEPDYTVSGIIEKRDMYDEMQIIYRSGDKDYKIEALSALQYIEGKECNRQFDNRVKEIKEYYGKAIKLGKKSTSKHRSDSSGKSKVTDRAAKFKNGDLIIIACYDWAPNMDWEDNYRLSIRKAGYDDYISKR
tara:strand:+ start:1176 stop:1751 length:576 start_codon:yes stop_codon:yes gene_type:complete